MTVKDTIAADVSLFFDTTEFAETVVYEGASIPAVVSRGASGAANDPAAPRRSPVADTALLDLSASDVAAPAYNDSVTISGESWRVHHIVSGDGVTWTLAITKNRKLQPR